MNPIQYDLLNDAGDVANTIMATGDDYMTQFYGTNWRRSVLPEPPPQPPEPSITVITKFEFMKRFTSDERKAINAAAKIDSDVEDFKMLLDAAQEVDLVHSDTVAGVNALETGGLLAAGRAAQILTP